MKQITKAVAYPTIPIVFLGGINPNRIPLYDTMGLAVTSVDETTRTETIIRLADKSSEKINFYLNGSKISGKRGKQIINQIHNFMVFINAREAITIHSNNYNIFSGSSDSGLAALFTALNDFFEQNLTKDELLSYAMKGSESAGRSLYGGLTLTSVKGNTLSVEQLASEQQLTSLKLFTIPFHYKSRISADEIHKTIITNPNFPNRVKNIPKWIALIRNAIQANDYITVLINAEENIKNAHELLEEVGLYVRKQEIMRLCEEIEQIRETGILAYYLIGGGNLVTIATIDKYSDEVTSILEENKWVFYKSKVAGPPRIIP
ncbi:MAG: hypothetical protein FK731_09440 [Asgard group archaeon]|nr:hypothetical protein [Asgard group archaeon]